MEQKISQCRIILYRTDPNKYSPALVNAVNEDGSVNLTVFRPGGDTGLVEKVTKGPEIGQWEWPGVDSPEKKAEKEPESSPLDPKLTSAYPIPGQK